MANRSDRRFQTLSPRMAARGRLTDQQNEARGNPSRPGLHLTPDKQAGYMTATEFQIASAIQPLTRAGSIYAWRSSSAGTELDQENLRLAARFSRRITARLALHELCSRSSGRTVRSRPRSSQLGSSRYLLR